MIIFNVEFLQDFNHPDLCWKDNVAGHKQSRRFLECVGDNFLLQAIEEPTRRGAMLHLVLTNNERLVGNVKIKGSLGCSDHQMAEFQGPRGSEEGAEQAHYAGLQDSRLRPLQAPAW